MSDWVKHRDKLAKLSYVEAVKLLYEWVKTDVIGRAEFSIHLKDLGEREDI